jgi:adenylate cyclase
MSEVFISYARSTEVQARQIGEALRALGHSVWRDDELPAHRAYADVIEERLSSAQAVVVVWSAEAVKSQWVRSEAERARSEDKLVQLTVDGSKLPMPFDQTQCADMNGWAGDVGHPGWRKVADSVAALINGGAAAVPSSSPAARLRPKLSICVLPFANMSGDAEQEYFSDGISEDIITDLSKVSALSVVSRNTAFTFKGKSIKVTDVARELNVSHVLEGSVRKAANRVRITAQLIDATQDDHIWAERYDRDLDDIFALQDEISEAIVAALKLKLLPEEKKAIERRGTNSAEAYDLYLMARQNYATGNLGDPRLLETVVRLCAKAVEIDPAYARAWALMGWAQSSLRHRHGRQDVNGSAAVDQALALDPDLAEAHAAKAGHLRLEGRYEEASEEAGIALRLDPESFETNFAAAGVCFSQGRTADAIPYFEKAAALMETDTNAPALLITCYTAQGNMDAARRAARMCLERAEAILAQDCSNGSAMGYGVAALAVLGEADRARDWIRRALLVDPDNQNNRYNFACALGSQLNDVEGALDILGPYLALAARYDLDWTKADPDMDALREDPRFQAMIAAAEARVAASESA